MFDLSSLTEPQRAIIQGALDRCTFDFSTLAPGLKAQTGKTAIPVEFADLSRYAPAESAQEAAGGHWHVHEGDDTAHVVGVRRRALGLAWYSGKVSVDSSLESDPDFAAEVFLAEGAHMVDFFYMTPSQREAIYKVYHPEMSDTELHAHGHGWFEETGNQDYWSWVGESFMSGFMVAFAPSVPQRMPVSQPWAHPTTPQVGAAIRSILQPQPDAPAVGAWGRRRSHVFHCTEHWGAGKRDVTWLTPAAAKAAGRRICFFCARKVLKG